MKSGDWQYVLVRHIVASKRKDFEKIRPLVFVPFETSGSTSSSGTDGLAFLTAPDGWMFAAKFESVEWVPLYSNAAAPEQIFQAQTRSRRSEVAWVGRHPKSDAVYFRLVRAREEVIRFQDDGVGSERIAVGTSDELCQAVLKCESGPDAFDWLCDRYSIRLPMPRVRVSKRKFQIVGVGGKPVRSELGQFTVMSARGLAAVRTRGDRITR